jgi:hypothetical protein
MIPPTNLIMITIITALTRVGPGYWTGFTVYYPSPNLDESRSADTIDEPNRGLSTTSHRGWYQLRQTQTQRFPSPAVTPKKHFSG